MARAAEKVTGMVSRDDSEGMAVKLLSTDYVREIMLQYISKEDDPLLYANIY